MGKRLGEGLTGNADSMLVVEELSLAQRAQGQVHGLRNVLELQAQITLRPADSAARAKEVSVGMTREIRSGSAIAVFSVPIAVGSFFQLACDPGVLDLPPMFARCDRCTLLAEDKFEAKFQFLHPVVLPGTVGKAGD